MELISDIDLEALEEELTNERIGFKDVAKYILDLNIKVEWVDKPDTPEQQYVKLIKICQVLLKFANEKLTKDRMDRYVFQCANCSKAFRRSEYLENHIQRRHGNKSLSENGIFPLIEQIKRYNSGLFVESSSIDDLKDEIKNLQTCLKNTCEDLIKEKIAREQLQRIIESEIIEKLNSLQATWSEPREECTRENESDHSNEQSDHQTDNQQTNDSTSQSADTKETRNFDLFLLRQNELIEKLGNNIDRFVERNDTKVNDEHLQAFISTTIHQEIESLLTNQEQITNDRNVETNKDALKTGNNRRFLTNVIKKDAAKHKEESKRESLHEFSIQNLNNINELAKDHTDDIVREIDQMINDETMTKSQTKVASFTSKIRKFPFKFRKSRSLIQLNGDELSKEEARKDRSNKGVTSEQANGVEGEINETSVNGHKNRDESISNEKIESGQNKTEKINEKAISRFRQFVWKKSDSQDNQDKINLSKFSTKHKVEEVNNNESDLKSNDDKNESSRNVKQVTSQTDKNQRTNSTTNDSNRTLKSVLRKSNSTDSSLHRNKLPKKSIAFSDERIEFSAEELDSSDTGSSYSISGNNTYLSATNQSPSSQPPVKLNYTLQPTEQPVTVQRVFERPTPAPRFVRQQPKTITSL